LSLAYLRHADILPRKDLTQADLPPLNQIRPQCATVIVCS